jgi:hypothetical protein
MATAAIVLQAEGQNCPTGKPCGATAPYCESYVAPSTSGATLISSLPYVISASGNYYLDSDLTSTGIGIAVKASNVDINLNGHAITYGAVANGSGASAIGEYGILACNAGGIAAFELDPTYGTNGYCNGSGTGGGSTATNITVENGTIIQSPNASQYYDPQNCPGSGIGSGSQGACSSHHETTASDVINIQGTTGITIRHMTLTWQNVDSDGIHLTWQQPGAGDVVECNTLNDKVTQINNRAYPRGMPISDMEVNSNQAPATYQYNTIIGTPQVAIGLGKGAPGAVVQYNDINQSYYQAPPFTSQLQSYSNDYAISCPVGSGSRIAYNYIHSVNGRGIGCIYQYDTKGLAIYGNYLSAGETTANSEYGPNGSVNGGAWIGGCEIDGGRGFEAKSSLGFSLYSNTFIVNVGGCGGGGIVFTSFPCSGMGSCPVPASASFNVHDNTIQIVNAEGRLTLGTTQQAACYIFDTAQGNYSNYFSPFLRDNCTSDGDFVATDGYDPGDYFSFISPTWVKGGHPLSSGCGWPGGGCGHIMHWQGNQSPPSDELGFVFQDVLLGNGASINFEGDTGSPLARSATIQWTYTPTVMNSLGGPIYGATVTARDAGGNTPICTTDAAGRCSVVLREEVVSSPVGNATLTTTNENASAVSITASGCSALNYNLTISAPTNDTRTLSCP